MKAFIFDLINKLQRASYTLDAKAILCNKTWRVFSDTGEKEVYIFMEDGKLVVSSNGIVEMGTWMYVPANQSLVITGKQNYLVHPVICHNILALIVDGTNQCAFLLDDTKRELEAVKSLQSISSYISSTMNYQSNNITGKVDSVHSVTSTSICKKDDYVFGKDGKEEGGSLYIDIRRLNRIKGNYAASKYSFGCLKDLSVYFTVHAYTNDYNSKLKKATFEFYIHYDKLECIYYYCFRTGASAQIYICDNSFLWYKSYRKGLTYYTNNHDKVGENNWFEKNAIDLKKDIDRFKEDLVQFLGCSDDFIYNLFRESWLKDYNP
jgi:hypothetical protein